MTAVDRPPRRLSGPPALLAAALLGLALMTGCTDSVEQAPSAPSEHGGAHHGGSGGGSGGSGGGSGGSGGGGHHPTPPTGHFDPSTCPTGLVC